MNWYHSWIQDGSTSEGWWAGEPAAQLQADLCYLSNEWQDQLHMSNSTTLTYESINYWTDLFKTDIFRRFMIQHRWLSHLFLFSPQDTVSCDKKVNIMNRQCHLKQRPRKAIILHVLPLASTWGRTANFNVFLHYLKIGEATVSSIQATSDLLSIVIYINVVRSYHSLQTVPKMISNQNHMCYDNI